MSHWSKDAPAAASSLRIALVEDDRELREEILLPLLVEAGFNVVTAGSASALYSVLRTAEIDLVVLDIGLPDGNGFDIARQVRAESTVGIVMLTARHDSTDRIRGLNTGADAYLPKPVDADLLVATLHSVGRRLGRQSARKAQRAWRLDRTGWHLFSPTGTEIELTASERIVLQQLFAAVAQPVGRESLIATLAGDSPDFDPHRLDVLVHRLRRKVLAAAGQPLPLRAIRGGGYLLTPDTRTGERREAC
jgi:DNA-binding response OmpR family regulator